MKQAMALMLLALACGGATEDEALITPTDDEPDVGVVEQEVVLDSGDYGWHIGLGQGAGNPRCSGSSFSCAIPAGRTVTYKIDPTGLSASQLADWQGSFDGSLIRLANDFPGWTLSRVTNGNATITIKLGDNNPATNKNSIHTYVYAIPFTTTLIDDFGRSGSFFRFGSATCEIDRTNIVRDFTSGGTPSQQTRVLNHAMDYCFHIGVGIGSGGAVARPHAVAVTPNANKQDAPSNRMKCLATAAATDLTGTTLTVRSDFQDLIQVCAGQSDN